MHLAPNFPISLMALSVLAIRPPARAQDQSSGAPPAPPRVASDRTREENSETHPYRLQDAQAARWKMESVEGHIAARRWSEAIDELQVVLEDHKSDVLAGERAKLENGRTSEQPTYPGAALRARARLWSLAREARELYRERHGAEAEAAFAQARDRSDRHALSEVARRYPLTDGAAKAWWALGDLELEIAHGEAALCAWSRAIACSLEQAELELTTPSDWQRAFDRLAQKNPAHSSGIDRRIALVLQRLQPASSAPGASGGSSSGASASPPNSTGKSAGAVTGSGALHGEGDHAASAQGGIPRMPGRPDVWSSPYRLPGPPHPFRAKENLFPARAGDRLLVSTSMRLIALGAFSGTALWDSGEPAGWSDLSTSEREEFFKGIDPDSALIGPAVSEHTAVAALQIPVAFIENVDFQGSIPITKRIPDRRLFAFDLSTGRPLWNHAPPPLWDGESGGFTARMSVAGPPVIAGTRILAPFYRMQGRIDYHVACFELESGELLWSTPLISGQRELNMFGRAEKEFCAPPLVVARDRVIALTQLGAVAALDLFTGEILWEAVYDQIPIQKTKDYGAARRSPTWQNAPPVVSQGTIVATPFDSKDMIGLDLGSGALLWSLGQRSTSGLAGASADIHLLVGARDDVVYLSGNRILALKSLAGLHKQAPTTAKWVYPDEKGHEDADLPERGGPRPSLGPRSLIVPSSTAALEIDLEQGRALGEGIAWASGSSGGNLLLGPGELFTLSHTQAHGYFEWNLLVDQARRDHERNPDDPHLALSLGQLLSNRGAGEWQRGNTGSARDQLAEARGVLERSLSGQAGEQAAQISVELHKVLRSQARVLAALADSAGALHELRRARTLAPNENELRDTLLEELSLLNRRDPEKREPSQRPGRAPDAAWSEVMTELERSCGHLTILCEPMTPDALRPENSSLPVRFTPIIGSPAKGDAVPCEMRVGLWVLLERAEAADRVGDTPGEFAALHAILEQHAEDDLPQGPAGELACERIGNLLRAGRTEGYAVFETRARLALDEALQKKDREAMRSIPRRFPFSKAALQADDALLDWAVEAADVGQVARIVENELSSSWQPEKASVREVRLCLRLSAVAQKLGNTELAGELVRTLAEGHPDLTSDLPADNGRTLGDLARATPRWIPRPGALPTGRFRANSKSFAQWPGDYEVLGLTQPDPAGANDPQQLVLGVVQPHPIARSASLYALAADNPQGLRWNFPFPPNNLPADNGSGAWTRRVVFAAGRVIAAGSTSIFGLDSSNGSKAWEWLVPAEMQCSVSLSCAAGVVVAVVRLNDGRSFIQALEARTGAALWREEQPDAGLQLVPLLSSNRVIFLPNAGRRQFLVRDLFTGRRRLAFEIDTPVVSSLDQDAWIEADRLILPWAMETRSPERNQVIAVDLSSGRRLWRVGFADGPGEKRMLTDIMQGGGRTWLVVSPWQTSNVQNPSCSILELSTGIGALAPVSNIRLSREDRVLGRRGNGTCRLTLPTSTILLLSRAPSGEARVRAIDLSSGELWAQSLLVPWEDVVTSPLPLPALSESTVALGFTQWPRREPQPTVTTSLVFLDRASGLVRDSRILHAMMEKADSLQLVPLGDALLVRGRHVLEILR